jgi:DNA-binding NarL/FixJ family response regulator
LGGRGGGERRQKGSCRRDREQAACRHSGLLHAAQAYQAGARAVLSKSEANKLLLAAVDSLLVHKSFGIGSGFDHMDCATLDEARLTPREQLVVKLVADGYSNKGISAILNLSVKTTEAHRAAAMRKLDVNSTAGLVRYAVRAKLVDE